MKLPLLSLSLILPLFACPLDPAETTVVTTTDPVEEEPQKVHLCLNLDSASLEFIQNLCKESPFDWKGDCSVDLQSCEDFVLALIQECGNVISSCEYEKCSKAIQAAPCGEFPPICQNLAFCISPPTGGEPTTGE